MMIQSALGLKEMTTEIATAPAFQIGGLVTTPVFQDGTSATSPTTGQQAVYHKTGFQNTTNTAATVISASIPTEGESSARLMREAAVQRSQPRHPPPLLWSHQAEGRGDFSNNFGPL